MFTCTKETPWTKEVTEATQHPDAEEVRCDDGNGYGGDVVTYLCPHCQLRFKMELPQ